MCIYTEGDNMTGRLHTCNCLNLRRAANKITAFYDGFLEKHDLTITQFSILSNVRKHKSINATQLASYMDLDRSTLVRNIKPLFEANLILEEVVGKSRNFQLSKQGEVRFQEALQAWKQAQDQYENYLGSSELDNLRQLLFKTIHIGE